MTDEDERDLVNVIGKFTDTLVKLNLMDFGNVWEWELELYEWWIRRIVGEK